MAASRFSGERSSRNLRTSLTFGILPTMSSEARRRKAASVAGAAGLIPARSRAAAMWWSIRAAIWRASAVPLGAAPGGPAQAAAAPAASASAAREMREQLIESTSSDGTGTPSSVRGKSPRSGCSEVPQLGGAVRAGGGQRPAIGREREEQAQASVALQVRVLGEAGRLADLDAAVAARPARAVAGGQHLAVGPERQGTD